MIYIKNLKPGQLVRWNDPESRTESLVILIHLIPGFKTRWRVWVIEDRDIVLTRGYFADWNFAEDLRACYFHV